MGLSHTWRGRNHYFFLLFLDSYRCQYYKYNYVNLGLYFVCFLLILMCSLLFEVKIKIYIFVPFLMRGCISELIN